LVIAPFLSYDQAMRYLAVITLLVLAACQTTVEQDWNAGMAAFKQGDYATALKHFRPLAEQGNARAQFNLGVWYRLGHGVAQDYAEALRWFRLAAEQGYVKAQNNLALMYHLGKGVAKDHAEAVRWLRKGAEQGEPKAQHNLGLMYQWGKGVAQDYAEAFRWIRKGAEQGDPKAQTSLGWMYQDGKGVAKDYAVAVKWYRKAANQGFDPAQYSLAKLEKKLRAEGNWPPKPGKAKAPGSPSSDIETRLRKLQKLVKEGLITKEDAARKRKELLDKL
jgi:TPR repeat protein